MPVPAQVQLQRDDLRSVTSAEGSLMGLQPGEPRGSPTALFNPGKSPRCVLLPHHQQVHVPAGVLTDRAALSPAWLGFSTLAGRGIKVSISAAPAHAAEHALGPKTRLSLAPSTPQASCPQPQQLPQRTWPCFAGWGATRATNPPLP